MWRDDAMLLDILLAAGDAREFVQALDWVGFSNSKLHQSAVERCMGVISHRGGLGARTDHRTTVPASGRYATSPY